jgi:ribosome-associated protein
VILDMRPECSFTDYFVIATGRNSRQTAAIWDEVHSKLKQDERLLPRSVDGMREGAWIVADYLDVVLHVFTPDAREYYRLEELWSDVPAVDVDAAAVWAGWIPRRVRSTLPTPLGSPCTSLPPSRRSTAGA